MSTLERKRTSARRESLLGDEPGAFASARYVRITAQKARRVVDLVRGLPVDDALAVFATLRGRPAIEEAYRQLYKAFPDIEYSVDTILIDPPRVAATITYVGTHMNDFLGLPGTNRRFEFQLARLLTVENGLIAHERRIYDFTGLLVQLGVLPAPDLGG